MAHSEGKFEADAKGGKIYRVYFTDDYGVERVVVACPTCELPFPGAKCSGCGILVCEECLAGVELSSGKVCRFCLLGDYKK